MWTLGGGPEGQILNQKADKTNAANNYNYYLLQVIASHA